MNITDPVAGHTILLSEITLAEVAAALAAKEHAPDGLTLEERDRALSRFLQECDARYLLMKVERSVVDLAVEFTQRHVLRGYDAVQLAGAWLANEDLTTGGAASLIFVASDRDLLTAAQDEGLATEDPLKYAG